MIINFITLPAFGRSLDGWSDGEHQFNLVQNIFTPFYVRRTIIRSAFTMMYSQSKSLISNNVLRSYCFINFPTKYKHKYLFDMKWLPGMLSGGCERNLQQHPNRRHDECCRAEFLIHLESKQLRVCRLSRLRSSHMSKDENIETEKGRQISFVRQRNDLPSSDTCLMAFSCLSRFIIFLQASSFAAKHPSVR